METEYKWNMPRARERDVLLHELELGSHVLSRREVHMHATYYDTRTGDVRDMRGGLRMRDENGERVCCLKLAVEGSGPCKTRQEYEVDAPDIIEGLRLLPDVGAPRDLCECLIKGDPQPTCETEFDRDVYRLRLPDFEAELAFDRGELRREGRTGPIDEVELEYVSGSADAFHAYARNLQEAYGLVPQSLSKLARAAAL